MTTYNAGWNSNEWFIVSMLIAGFAAVVFLPKRFPLYQTILFSVIGFFFVVVVDHSISIPPFDYYDVNDSNKYEFTDTLSYLMFGPFGYLFLYVFDRLGRPYRHFPLYVLGWGISGLILEKIAVLLEVFHYKNGYRHDFSTFVYISLQCVLIAFYRFIRAVG